MKAVLATLLALATIGCALFGVSAYESETDLAAERTEKLVVEAELLGYKTAFVAVSAALVEKDSVAKAFAAEARLARARTVIQTRTVVQVQIDTVLVAETVTQDSIMAKINIDPVYGMIGFYPPDQFALALICAPEIELFYTQPPTGNWLVAARALSGNTYIRHKTLEIPMPPVPPSERGKPLLSAGIGALLGAAVWELLR